MIVFQPKGTPLVVVLEKLIDPSSIWRGGELHVAYLGIVVHGWHGQRFAIPGGVFPIEVVRGHAVLICGIAGLLDARAVMSWAVPTGEVRTSQGIVRDRFVKQMLLRPIGQRRFRHP